MLPDHGHQDFDPCRPPPAVPTVPDIASVEAMVREHFDLNDHGQLAPEDLPRAVLRLLLPHVATSSPTLIVEVAPKISCPHGLLCAWLTTALVAATAADRVVRTIWLTLRQEDRRAALTLSCETHEDNCTPAAIGDRAALATVERAVSEVGGALHVAFHGTHLEIEVAL